MSGAPKRSWSRYVIDAPSCAPAPAAKGGVVRRGARGLDGVADAEATERVDGVGPQRDAGADLAQLVRALEHENLAAAPLQRDRGREAADSGADDQGAIVHAPRLWRPARRSRRRSSQSGPAGLGSAGAFRQRGRVGRCRGPDRTAPGPRRSGALVIRGEPGRRQVGAARARGRARDGRCGCCVPGGSRPSPSSRSPRCTSSSARSSTASSVLPSRRRPRLRVRSGCRAMSVEDRFLIGVAVLSLLAEAAEEEPLVCVVDDAQWLDRPVGRRAHVRGAAARGGGRRDALRGARR